MRLTGSWTLSNLPVLLLLLHLSLLFEAFLRHFLAFLYPFAFLFHNALLSSAFLCLGPSILQENGEQPTHFLSLLALLSAQR